MEYNITYRQKDKGWQYIISYKQDGKWKYRTSKQGFRTKALAKVAAEDKLDATKGEDRLKEENKLKLVEEHSEITLGQFKKIFLADLVLYREPNTLIAYETAFLNLDIDDGTIVENIEFAHIQNCVNKMIKQGLKPSTIKLYVSKWKILFVSAVKPYKIIAENPITDDLRLPKIEKNTKIKALTKAGLDDLLNKMYPEKDYIICLLASHCGMRIGEILGLCEKDIDLKKCKVDINEQWKKLKDGSHGFGTVKSKTRVVPIPASIKPILENYLSSSNVKNFDRRIFSDKNTQTACSRIDQKMKKMGYDNSIHDLRHTYATRLVASGLDYQTIAEYMGDSVKTVIDTYSHFTKDMAEVGAQKVNDAF